MIRINFQKNDSSGEPLPLKDYDIINLERYVDSRYSYKNSNKFDREASYDYNLISVVVHSGYGFEHEEYVTYSLDQLSRKWVRYSRFGINLVSEEEVFTINFPYLLIYERKFEKIKERSNIQSHLKLSTEMEFSDQLPIPDFWIQKATS